MKNLSLFSLKFELTKNMSPQLQFKLLPLMITWLFWRFPLVQGSVLWIRTQALGMFIASESTIELLATSYCKIYQPFALFFHRFAAAFGAWRVFFCPHHDATDCRYAVMQYVNFSLNLLMTPDHCAWLARMMLWPGQARCADRQISTRSPANAARRAAFPAGIGKRGR